MNGSVRRVKFGKHIIAVRQHTRACLKHTDFHGGVKLQAGSGCCDRCAAGRIASAERMALAGIRAQCTCMAMGQAMGAAAALAVKKAIPSREVSPTDIVALCVPDTPGCDGFPSGCGLGFELVLLVPVLRRLGRLRRTRGRA